MPKSHESLQQPRHGRQTKKDLEAHVKARRVAALIVNTRSRRGQRLYSRAKTLLEEKGITLGATYPVRDPVRLPEVVKENIAHGVKLVIIGGGDGTISSVVDELAYKDVVLGILPLGTANSFARTLAIPLSVGGAVEVIVAGKVADVDLGKIDDDYFANASALGLSSSIGRSKLHLIKRYLGRAGYLIVASAKFFSHRAFRCTLTYDDRTVTVEALDVLIANGPYHGGVFVVREAAVESRDLVIRIIKGPNKWNLLKAWKMIAIGSSPGPPLIELVRTSDVWIEASPTQYVSIDGEVVTRTPVRASIAREALKLMVPPEF